MVILMILDFSLGMGCFDDGGVIMWRIFERLSV